MTGTYKHTPFKTYVCVTSATFIVLALLSCSAFAAEPSNTSAPQAGSTFRDCPDCPEMVVIPKGTFLMGSSAEDIERDIVEVPNNQKAGIPYLTRGAQDYMAEEQPQHPVSINESFALGKYPVTRGEFTVFVREAGYRTDGGCTLFMNNKYRKISSASWQNPGFIQTDRDPVVCVNWYDARAYIAWLNNKVMGMKSERSAQMSGDTYHLPSESEWEYATRAGTQTTRWWGNSIGSNNADCNGCGSSWDKKGTAPVGSFQANPFKLYDVLGNVFQWTDDCWNNRYSSAPSDGRPWTTGYCNMRVTRGGSWSSDSWVLRSAARPRGISDERNNYTGFRVTKTIM